MSSRNGILIPECCSAPLLWESLIMLLSAEQNTHSVSIHSSCTELRTSDATGCITGRLSL